MKDFKDYKILLKPIFFDRYQNYLSNNKINNFSGLFNIDKIKIDDESFSEITVKYNDDKDLFINKEIFDINSIPQLFKLKTNGKIFNFIDKSHFMVGFTVALHILQHHERIFFIEELRNDNFRYNPPLFFEEKIKFVLMVNKNFMSKILVDYNLLYNSNLEIIETFFSEGEEFCVIELDKGSPLDLFCLGAFYLLAQLHD